IGFLIYYFINGPFWSDRLLHFNFSRERSIFLFLLLPKFSSRFCLMLHHGGLKVRKEMEWLYRLSLARLDYVFCISEGQRDFFRALRVPENKLRMVSSYVKAVPKKTEGAVQKEIEGFFRSSRVLIAS